MAGVRTLSIKSSLATIRGGGANHPPKARPTTTTRMGRVDHCFAAAPTKIREASWARSQKGAEPFGDQLGQLVDTLRIRKRGEMTAERSSRSEIPLAAHL